MRTCSVILCLLAMAFPVSGGEHNEVLNIGDPGPAWQDLPGTDGRKHSLADLKQDFVVVVFTCNSCPVARDYEDRIMAFARRYENRVGVVAINVNRIPEDRLSMMQARATERGFPYPYLWDESQQIARDYGAVYTPEFFVLDRDRKVVYMGGMDDNSQVAEVKHRYLDHAMEALLAGRKPEPAETLARGCRIRYARERK